jgi:hypothetical protein
MKTREEFKAAINEMLQEAEKSGFTLCIGFDAEGVTILAAQGNRPTMLGLTDAMHHQFFTDFISDRR